MLTAARAVKLNGWVRPLAARLAACRAAEAKPLRAAAMLRASNSMLRDIPSVAGSLATFGTLAALAPAAGLRPEKVFVVMALFNSVVRVMAIAPLGLQALAESQAGMQRLSQLLRMSGGSLLLPAPGLLGEQGGGAPKAGVSEDGAHGEAAPGVTPLSSAPGDTPLSTALPPIRLRGSFSWVEVAQPPKAQAVEEEARDEEAAAGRGGDRQGAGGLWDLDLELGRGQLTAVVGPVGAGKTSLILSLLGELHEAGPGQRSHQARRAALGRCAYAPQEAWVLNASLRDNVLLRRPPVPQRYQSVLSACALGPDLERLPAGDQTDVGERGVTLSGGQRARLSLARCAYGEADTYLLDDPLAAVDPATAALLVENVLFGLMAGATRVLVTHSPAALARCDSVVVLAAGRVVFHGAPAALAAAMGPPRALAAEGPSAEDGLAAPTDEAAAAVAVLLQEIKEEQPLEEQPSEQGIPHKLVEKEASSEGAVTMETYRAYYTAAGGAPVALAIAASYLLQAAAATAAYLWLAWWSDGTWGVDTTTDVAVYAGLVGASAVMSLIRARALTAALLHASSSLHDAVLEHVLRSPVSFFDQTPVGRIVNRFSKDQEVLDSELPVALQTCAELFAASLAAFAVVTAILPYFALSFPVMVAGCLLLRNRYVALSRETKRMDGVTRSPLISHLGVTLAGLPCVRAYGVGAVFEEDNWALLDANAKAHWLFIWCGPSLCSLSLTLAVAPKVRHHAPVATTLPPRGSAGRWVGVRLDLLAALAASAAAACVAGATSHGASHGGGSGGGGAHGELSLPPGLAGMALVLSLTFAGTLQCAPLVLGAASC